MADINLEKKSIRWHKEHENILIEWADKAMCYRWLHSKAHNLFSYKNAWFTIPVIVISTCTGTANFAQDRVHSDYRNYVVRYEGDVYNNIEAPLSPHNKVWINFGTSVLQEPVSCYIDSLEYNMKRNTYKVVMHIPNQDDDESSDFVIRF